MLKFFLVKSKSEEILYLLGEGESVLLTSYTFFPRPMPDFGDLPKDEGML
jgi:hypothetical protein